MNSYTAGRDDDIKSWDSWLLRMSSGWTPSAENILEEDLDAMLNQLVTLFQHPDRRTAFFELRDERARYAVNLVQVVADRNDIPRHSKRILIRALAKLSKESGRWPECLLLTGVKCDLRYERQVAAGGYADIYRGTWNGGEVAVKVLRLFGKSATKELLKNFAHEAVLWRQLSHPNLLRFYGVAHLKNLERPCLISQWMVNGNLRDFLNAQKNRDVDRMALLSDIICGIQYLHEHDMVHSDLKLDNILIDSQGHACLADFGVASIRVSLLPSTSSGDAKGTMAYTAPEVLLGGPTSPASDIYAFAYICYEVMTDKQPFGHLRQHEIFRTVAVNNERPLIPPCMCGHQIWPVVEDCWKTAPEDRPTAKQVIDTNFIVTSTPDDDHSLPASQQQEPLPSENEDNESKRDRDSKGKRKAEVVPDDERKRQHIEASSNPVEVPVHATSGELQVPESSPPTSDASRDERIARVRRSKERKQKAEDARLLLLRLLDRDDVLSRTVKKRSGWQVVFNPKPKKGLDISLMHEFWSLYTTCMKFSVDGKYLGTGGLGAVEIYDTVTGAEICSLEKTGDVYNLCFSPDSNYLAVEERKRICIWNMSEKRIIFKKELDPMKELDPIVKLEFSADGQLVLFASKYNTVEIWNMESGSTKKFTMFSESGLRPGWEMGSVAFSLDGRLIAAGSLDMNVRIWDVWTGALLKVLKGHIDIVRTVAFTPDGKGLVSGGGGQPLKYWDLNPLLSTLARKDVLADSYSALRAASDSDEVGDPPCVCTMNYEDHDGHVDKIAVPHSGAWVIMVSAYKVYFWEQQTAQMLLELQFSDCESLNIFEISPSGGFFATLKDQESAIKIWKYTPE